MKKFLASRFFRFIWSAALATLLYFACPPCFDKTTLLIILTTLFLLVNLSEMIARAVVVTHVARVLVGVLFIFSGFIKANDPLGFSYKLEEYFEVFKADTGLSLFEGMAHMALPFAIIICFSEMALGVMLLIGFKRELTLWLLFAQIAFFTFLTFYSACYNKVTHCGCFGDFLKLRPWESFWKDIALMILITVLFAGKENINPPMAPMISHTSLVLGLALSLWFPIYAYRNLPPIDFRAYAPGMNIRKNMEKGEGYQDPVYQSLLVYENLKTGELKELNQDDFMKSKIWEDTLTWKWHSTDNKLITEAVNPPLITDFTVNDALGNNLTDSLLNDKGYSVWIIMHQLDKTTSDPTVIAQITDFVKLAQQDGVKIYGFTASSNEEVEKFKKATGFSFPFLTADNIVLKTMIRSNPGFMLVKEGTVITNWHYRNMPVYSELKGTYFK